jgi:predicted TPR repeat methyltransferase
MTSQFDQARDHFLEGVRHFEAARLDEAERSFLASLAILPGRVSTRVNLAATRLRLGRPAQALVDLEAILAVEPEHMDAWCHRATALADLGRNAESLACADQVLRIRPDDLTAWTQRGHALERLQRHAEALHSFDRLAALQPEHVDTRFRRAQGLQRLGRLAEALQANDQVLALQSAHVAAFSQRGMLLKDLAQPEAAAAAFEQAIALGADAELHRFYLASLGRHASPAVAPRQYVQALFDDYAHAFEEHLVGVLGYQAHRRLVAALPELHPDPFDAALDLGCGTGLCGPPLRPLARRLDGVDLSQAMLDRAAALGVYDGLLQAEVVEHLARSASSHDLVLAADVFIYVGELGEVFTGVQRILRPGGLFCFTVERAGDEHGAMLMPHLRYAHSLPYLRGLARQHGLQELRVAMQPIRQDQTKAIPGLYVYLRKP